MAVPKKTVVIEPRTKPRYTLAELLAKSARNALKPSRRDHDWLSGGPAGKEAILKRHHQSWNRDRFGLSPGGKYTFCPCGS